MGIVFSIVESESTDNFGSGDHEFDSSRRGVLCPSNTKGLARPLFRLDRRDSNSGRDRPR